MMKLSKTRTIMRIVMSRINHLFSYDKHSLPFPLMLGLSTLAEKVMKLLSDQGRFSRWQRMSNTPEMRTGDSVCVHF